MGVRMRLTRAKTKSRRSHHALSEPRLSKCVDCGEPVLRHRACESCGKYRGRAVIDVALKAEKKEKREKKKRAEAGAGQKERGDAPKAEEKEVQTAPEVEQKAGPISVEEMARRG